MNDLQNAQAEVCAAYVASAFFYQKINAQYFCALAKDRADIVLANAKEREFVEQRILEAETNLSIAKSNGEK